MQTLYSVIVSVVGIPDSSYRWLAYATACILLCLGCWALVKIADFIFHI